MSSHNGTITQAVRGPLMLITLGSLVAMDNFMNVSFSRTWPVLIIVYGAMKLLERFAAAPRAESGGAS